MKNLFTLAIFLAAFATGLAQSDNFRRNGAFYANPSASPADAPQGFKWALLPNIETQVFAAIGGSGIQTASEAIPSGADWKVGFLMRAGSMAFAGNGGYSGYYLAGKDNKYLTFEGTMGAFVFPELALTAGFSYYGDQVGTQGQFALVVRPYLRPFTFGRFSALVSMGFILGSETRTWQALAGVSYRLHK